MMKVSIGPYPDDLIPINRWERRYEMMRSGAYFLDEDDYSWYDRIVFRMFDRLRTITGPINRWSNNRKQKVTVKIDHYDVWSMYSTLAHIIVPMLNELKRQKRGVPLIDGEDVPEHIRVLTDGVHMDGTPETNHEARWEYILDEMIWTFEQCSKDDDTEQFHHNVDQLDMISTPIEGKSGYSELTFNYQKDPTRPKYWLDEEGLKAHHERKKNGLRLFGKYYNDLWD